MANRLAGSLSPYLLQHADNPVAWFPWGDEAFAAARERDVPVLLSVGYAACHWCHVMAHESFEDPRVAAVMNERFVNVKVDREERPDVDAIYMGAVQLMTGSGGWPMTVFLTPAGEPFYGGTYYPPQDRHGMPGFPRVLGAIHAAWSERRQEVERSAAELTRRLRQVSAPFAKPADAGTELPIGADDGKAGRPAGSEGVVADAVRAGGAGADAAAARLLESAVDRLLALEDTTYGGLGPAPKFPPHAALQFLLTLPDERAVALAVRTLDAMAAGGIADQLGGGFFRYSVDRQWHVPHFEKMLYDNAQLLRAYAAAFARTGEERHRRVAYAIVAWLEREMKVAAPGSRASEGSANGGSASEGSASEGSGLEVAAHAAYVSALDADSEGEEGRYYAWSAPEFEAALTAEGADAALAAAHYGVTPGGDFEGGNVLRLARSAGELAAGLDLDEELVRARLELASAALLGARSRRVRPASDDKVLTSWNALALTALAEAGAAFADHELIARAGGIARFIRAQLWRDGRLLHAWRAGRAEVDGLLEDYAFLGLGLVAYYRAALEPWALQWAFELADVVERRFRDEEGGGYFNTADDAEDLLLRPKGFLDGATPSENAAAAELAWWVARYRSDTGESARALGALQGLEAGAEAAPQAFGSALRLLAMDLRPEREVVLVAARGAPPLAEAMTAVRSHGHPADVVLQLDDSRHPLADLPLAGGRVAEQPPSGLTAYVCSGGVCRLPVHDPAEVARLLAGA